MRKKIDKDNSMTLPNYFPSKEQNSRENPLGQAKKIFKEEKMVMLQLKTKCQVQVKFGSKKARIGDWTKQKFQKKIFDFSFLCALSPSFL